MPVTPLPHRPVRTIAAKDIRDALRDRFIVIVTLFLGLAALTALLTGAIAMRTDVATYDAAKATLLALGKSADAITAPEFYPLRLLRGGIEQTEIVGAAIAILIGYRSASGERGRQTLALILTRPLRASQFVVGKALAGLGLLAGGLALVLGGLAVTLHLTSGIDLGADDLLRLAIVWGVTVVYTGCFFLKGFILTLHMRHPSHALGTFRALDGFSVPAGGEARLHFDDGTMEGDFRANSNSIYTSSQAAKTFDVSLKIDGFAPAVVQIAKDKGGAETAD